MLVTLHTRALGLCLLRSLVLVPVLQLVLKLVATLGGVATTVEAEVVGGGIGDGEEGAEEVGSKNLR